LGGQGVDRNKLTKVLGFVFPTIALLPGTDEDLPPGCGLAKRLQIHLGNVAYPVLRDGEQAEAGPVAPLLPAGAAWGLGKDHNVLGHRSGELQLDAQPPVCVAEAQRLNRVRAKGHRRGRPEQPVAVNTSPGAVDPYEMLLPGQRTTLVQTRTAQDFRRRRDPGLLLFVCQESTESLREGAESPARAPGGRVAHAFRNNVRPLALPVADHKENHVAAPATFGDIQHVHLLNSQAFIAALTDRLGAPE
jgi:hypothetical protein